eukprot:3131796-Rhodomonas_salina.4
MGLPVGMPLALPSPMIVLVICILQSVTLSLSSNVTRIMAWVIVLAMTTKIIRGACRDRHSLEGAQARMHSRGKADRVEPEPCTCTPPNLIFEH